MCSLSLVNIRVNRLSKLPSTHPVFFSLSLDLAAFSFQRDSFFVLIQLGYQPSGDIGWWKRHPVKAFLSFTMAVLQNKRNFLWVFLGSGDLFLCGQWPVVHYKCLTIARQKKKKKKQGGFWFVEFSNCHGAHTPTLVNYKLSMWFYWTQT